MLFLNLKKVKPTRPTKASEPIVAPAITPAVGPLLGVDESLKICEPFGSGVPLAAFVFVFEASAVAATNGTTTVDSGITEVTGVGGGGEGVTMTDDSGITEVTGWGGGGGGVTTTVE